MRRLSCDWRAVIGLAILLGGCREDVNSDSAEAAQAESSLKVDDETVRALRAALPRAAGMSRETLSSLTQSETSPHPGMFDDQPLTLALLCLPLHSAPSGLPVTDLTTEIRPLSSVSPRPSALVAALALIGDSDLLSIVADKNIRELTCETSGETAAGTVQFEVPECFVATVQYRAHKTPQGWQITEFHLPLWDIHVVADAAGVWKTNGIGATDGPVQLPRVEFAIEPVMDGRPPAFWLGASPSIYAGLPEPAQSLEGSLFRGAGDPLPISSAKELLVVAIRLTLKSQPMNRQSRVYLKVDRRVRWNEVEAALTALRECGVEQVRFAAETQSTPDPQRLQLEWLRVPGDLALELVAPQIDEVTSIPPLRLQIDGNSRVRIGERELGASPDAWPKVRWSIANLTEGLGKEQWYVELQVRRSEELTAKDMLQALSACQGTASEDVGDAERIVGGQKFSTQVHLWMEPAAGLVEPMDLLEFDLQPILQ